MLEKLTEGRVGFGWIGTSIGILFLLISIVVPQRTSAQWVQTNGPYGGQVNSLVSIGNYIFTCAGGAVLCSTNDGTTWNATGSTGDAVSDIVNEGNKLIAVGSAIFVSRDDGAEWSSTGSSVPWINLQVLAANNTALFASANNGLVSHLGYSLYRSTDDGANWTSVGSGLGKCGSEYNCLQRRCRRLRWDNFWCLYLHR